MKEDVKDANAVLHRSRQHMHDSGLQDDRRAIDAMKNLKIGVAEILCRPLKTGPKPTLKSIAERFVLQCHGTPQESRAGEESRAGANDEGCRNAIMYDNDGNITGSVQASFVNLGYKVGSQLRKKKR